MQNIVVKSVIIKEGIVKTGKNAGNPYKSWTINGQDGSSVTTFDMMAGTLHEGDTIEAELVMNGKYTNLKSFRKVGGGYPQPPIDSVEKAFAEPAKPFAPPVVVPPIVVRTTKAPEIAEAVAVKAIVELACAKVLPATDQRVQAAINWCTDKLSHYLPQKGSDIPLPVIKPSVGGTGDADVDKRMLLSLVKSNMKFPDEKTAISWLINVAKIPQTRIDSEPGNVFAEVSTKQGWD